MEAKNEYKNEIKAAGINFAWGLGPQLEGVDDNMGKGLAPYPFKAVSHAKQARDFVTERTGRVHTIRLNPTALIASLEFGQSQSLRGLARSVRGVRDIAQPR